MDEEVIRKQTIRKVGRKFYGHDSLYSKYTPQIPEGSTFGGYKYSEQCNDRSIQRTEERNHYLGRGNRTCRSDIGIQRL